MEKLDLNQQSTYVQSNFDEKVSLDNLHLFQCNMNADTSIYVDNSVLGGYYITHSTREYRNKYINEYVYDTDSGIFIIRCQMCQLHRFQKKEKLQLKYGISRCQK